MGVRMGWGRPLRVLDFDLENRPLSYGFDDFTFSEVTAAAACWTTDQASMQAWILGHECSKCGHNDGVGPRAMFEGFRALYLAADVVTGHNIIRHDLPALNGASLEYGYGPLPPILAHDTYRHLKRRRGVSASQESLAEMLGVPAPKIGMGQVAWRRANRLLPDGLALTRARVVGDVHQHMLLRAELLRRDWLRPPTIWRP